MTTPTDPAAEIFDQSNTELLQQIAELRRVIERTAPLLAFAAGLEAADEPGYAERMMAGAEEMKAVLERTGTAQL